MSKVPRIAILAAVVVLGALAVTSWQVGWFGRGGSATRAVGAPIPVSEVPSSLPPGGVKIAYSGLVLRPWPSAPAGAMSARRAIAAARRFTDGQPYPAVALKTEVVQTGFTPPHRPRDSWLVTFTYPKRVDVGVAATAYATRQSVAVDAVTGKFVAGCFC